MYLFSNKMSMSNMFKRKRLFYSPEDDLNMLKEVVGQNPFEDPSRWTDIKKNINELCGKDFSDRSLKARVSLLAQKYCEKSEKDIYKSGVEEEVSEIDDLLYTLVQLMNEFKVKPTKTESSHQKGLNCREQALTNLTNETIAADNWTLSATEDEIMEHFSNDPRIELKNPDVLFNIENDVNANNENITPGIHGNKRNLTKDGRNGRRGGGRGGGIMTPTRTRISGGLKQSSIRLLEKKNERWFEIRSKELALQEKKLEIEANEKTKRLEIDAKRILIEEKRLEMEEKRFKAELQIFENQQRLMEMAFLTCKKH